MKLANTNNYFFKKLSPQAKTPFSIHISSYIYKIITTYNHTIITYDCRNKTYN